jgi:hypothetical protein
MNIIKIPVEVMEEDVSHSNQSLFSTAGRNTLLLCLSISVMLNLITCAVVSSLELKVKLLE